MSKTVIYLYAGQTYQAYRGVKDVEARANSLHFTTSEGEKIETTLPYIINWWKGEKP
jgi:hypothetical protein